MSPETIASGDMYDEVFYYVTNLQGDVMALLDADGRKVGSYSYTAYGEVSISMGHTVTLLNPLLYRGYVHDLETGLYYLQSRYYDPEMGRFINADSYTSTGQGVLGNNMFAYCLNNPVIFSDSSGQRSLFSMSEYDKPLGTYIIDQTEDPWGKMPLGSSTVGKMGCGLVAIYNAMISLDDFRSFSQIYDFFDGYPSGLTDHGKNGLFIGYVAAFFLSEGYHVVILTSFEADLFTRYSQNADAWIMLYQFGAHPNSGGHYIEYEKCELGYLGRNTNEGNGTYTFQSPAEYSSRGNRSFAWGIFVFKT